MADEPILVGEGGSAGPGARPPRRAARPRMSVLVIAAGVVLVASAVAVGLAGPSAAPDPPPPVLASPEAPDAGILPGAFAGEVFVVATDGMTTTLESLGRDGWSVVERLPPLDWARFDVSGRFLAGTAGPGSGLSELWVWRDGGGVDRVATAVRAFAWHDTRPGELAWTALTPGAELALTTDDVGGGAGPAVRGVFDLGQLRRWGDWGYAILLPGRPLRTLLVDPLGEGQVELAGYPVGEVAPGVPGFTIDAHPDDPPDRPTYGYRDGEVGAGWLPDGEFVRAFEPGEALTAVVASPTGLREAGRALLVNASGGVVDWGVPATGPAPLAWDLSSRHALTGSTDDRGRAVVGIVDTVTGRQTAVSAGARVILDLAVVSRSASPAPLPAWGAPG